MNARRDGVITGYVALRYGTVVGVGDTRALAYRDAAANHMHRCTVWPVSEWLMAHARRDLAEKTWTSELEFMREVAERAAQGLLWDWPFGEHLDDDAHTAILDELAELERMEAVSTTQVSVPEHETRRAVEAFPGWSPYAEVRCVWGGASHAD